VAPRVGARLVSLDKDERSVVHKDELLGHLEAADLASNIAQLEAQAAFAEADYGRYARLMRGNATTQQAFDHALATRNAAVSAVRQARSQAGFMNLRSPGDCTVIERNGEIGQFIAANTPVFWLSCHAALRISAQVDEEDIPLVKLGQKVLIRADAFPGRTFRGRVDQLTPKGDPIGRSYRVRIGLPADNPLQIGMTTEANIVVRENERALLLPASAVLGNHVSRVRNGRVEQVPIVLGAKGNDWVEVVHGVSSSDLIIQNASSAPTDGNAFRIRLANS
jgi:multidrug efflux system membrane fusion protein